jgi:hypothetical protein
MSHSVVSIADDASWRAQLRRVLIHCGSSLSCVKARYLRIRWAGGCDRIDAPRSGRAAQALAGIVLAAVTSRLVVTLLYGVRTLDVMTYLSATLVLFGVTLLAGLIPGRRATAIHPVEALREP